jgi:hypothetical protein
MEQAIVHTEVIKRKGELKYFQIPLPGSTKKVIGVEVSAFLLTPIPPDPPVNPPPAGGGNCPNPGTAAIDPFSDMVAGAIRNQVFKIGPAVNPGFEYSCGVYGVTISITAVDGDTPATIASKLAQAVENTPFATWIQSGSNNQNYKPTGSSNGDLLIVTTDSQHSFFAAPQGSCGGPAPVQYDPLFTISNNKKAGMLSLQSPDITDIFLQTDVFAEDRNIQYADFTINPLSAGEWFKGKKRIATDVRILTTSPILEAYYKDSLGLLQNSDMQYQLNIYIWFEKSKA